jgi:hypothetical protein
MTGPTTPATPKPPPNPDNAKHDPPPPGRVRSTIRRVAGPAASATTGDYLGAAAVGLGTAGATIANGGPWWAALIAGLGSALGTLGGVHARKSGQPPQG